MAKHLVSIIQRDPLPDHVIDGQSQRFADVAKSPSDAQHVDSKPRYKKMCLATPYAPEIAVLCNGQAQYQVFVIDHNLDLLNRTKYQRLPYYLIAITLQRMRMASAAISATPTKM